MRKCFTIISSYIIRSWFNILIILICRRHENFNLLFHKSNLLCNLPYNSRKFGRRNFFIFQSYRKYHYFKLQSYELSCIKYIHRISCDIIFSTLQQKKKQFLDISSCSKNASTPSQAAIQHDLSLISSLSGAFFRGNGRGNSWGVHPSKGKVQRLRDILTFGECHFVCVYGNHRLRKCRY